MVAKLFFMRCASVALHNSGPKNCLDSSGASLKSGVLRSFHGLCLGGGLRVSAAFGNFGGAVEEDLRRGVAAIKRLDPDRAVGVRILQVAASSESVAMEDRVTELEQGLLVDTATPASQLTSLHNKNSKVSGYQDFLTGLKPGQHNDRLVVVGHRGCGKNKTLGHGESHEARPSIRENTIVSFNTASRFGADFVEFDVQVTKDGHPIIFHDDYIIVEDMVPRKIGELTLEEFLGIGPQKDAKKNGRTLYRKARDGHVGPWTVNMEDSMCTLQEAFESVDQSVGFNIEVKFDDVLETSDEEMRRVIFPILEVVKNHANGRKIYYSSFHPDAVHLLGGAQSSYPVFFLTDGGVNLYNDQRRNSIQAAIQVCQQSNLQGIVSEVRAILHEASLVTSVKQAGLWLFTYGELNNVAEAVHNQKVAGVDGVIVDHVLEMVTEARHLEKLQQQENGCPQETMTIMPLTVCQ